MLSYIMQLQVYVYSNTATAIRYLIFKRMARYWTSFRQALFERRQWTASENLQTKTWTNEIKQWSIQWRSLSEEEANEIFRQSEFFFALLFEYKEMK